MRAPTPIRELSLSEQFGHRRIDVEVTGHHGFVIMPDAAPGKGDTPWVWYAPHFAGATPRELHTWICTRVLGAGTAVAGVDVGESYGSPGGRRVFTEFHEAVVHAYGLAPRACLLAQSRGGLMHYNWAVEHPDLVLRIAGIYPVCDLTHWPGIEAAARVYELAPEEFRKQLSAHNPIERLAPLAAARVPILHLHGDADTVIPLDRHSAALARRYRDLGGRIELVVVPGIGHQEVSAFFESQRLVDFLTGNY